MFLNLRCNHKLLRCMFHKEIRNKREILLITVYNQEWLTIDHQEINLPLNIKYSTDNSYTFKLWNNVFWWVMDWFKAQEKIFKLPPLNLPYDNGFYWWWEQVGAYNNLWFLNTEEQGEIIFVFWFVVFQTNKGPS